MSEVHRFKEEDKERRAHVPAKKTAADVEDADAILKKSKKGS